MMKGLEGLPLKYILIVLVAALIIAAVVTVVTGWTQSLQEQSNKTTETMSEGTSKSLCDMRENTGTCYKGSTTYSQNATAWICNSTATKQYVLC
jgi:archaellin